MLASFLVPVLAWVMLVVAQYRVVGSTEEEWSAEPARPGLEDGYVRLMQGASA